MTDTVKEDAHGQLRGLTSVLPIATGRLRIRSFERTDADALYELHRDPLLTRYAGGRKTREESEASLERLILNIRCEGFGALAVEEQPSKEVIGWCGIQLIPGTPRYEIIYALRPDKWGAGFALEAAIALMSSAFRISHPSINEIYGLVFPQNLRSIRVLEKIGMTFIEHIFDRTIRRYASLYSVRRPDFFSLHKR